MGVESEYTSSSEQHRTLLAALVEGSEDAIVSKSLEGVINFWNPAAERIFGFSAAEAVGQPISIIVPADLSTQEDQILAKVRRGERVDHLETQRLLKDGRRLAVSLTISPVRDAQGQIIGASQIARDITERRRLEHELYESQRHKDEFVAMLGHELRNPLAPIANGTLLLRRYIAEVPDIGRLCDMFDRQIDTMRRLLDDLLDVSRLNRGTIRFRRQPLDLQPIVQSSIETCRPLIERQRHRLSVEMPPEPLRVLGDSMRLTQAISNLLNNAARYTPSDGAIGLIAARVDGHVTLRVCDNGIGIDPSLLPHIFDLFVQGDPAIGNPQSGLGVGLSLVQSIVAAHGGSIEAFSAGRDQGSEFRMKLPALPADGST
ncbi:MAG TPA: PAS domain-containing sensor histidine kinase [Steroidobacteraceae bacterium]|jgi:PAS domain S-box-containing protein|nr:PAS domain-containing sensor histidine kinase [Steroidobacteraceae bacterium]